MPVNNNNGGVDVSGTISNHITLDMSNIFQFFTMMHYLWAVPIKIIILLILLYRQMGISAICGSTIFFIFSPFQYYCSRQISKIQKLQLVCFTIIFDCEHCNEFTFFQFCNRTYRINVLVKPTNYSWVLSC